VTSDAIEIALLQAAEVKILLRVFVPAAKLDTLFIHVPDVLWRKVGIGGKKVLKEFEVTPNVHRVEILSTFQVEA
jgi:hypothetical protein